MNIKKKLLDSLFNIVEPTSLASNLPLQALQSPLAPCFLLLSHSLLALSCSLLAPHSLLVLSCSLLALSLLLTLTLSQSQSHSHSHNDEMKPSLPPFISQKTKFFSAQIFFLHNPLPAVVFIAPGATGATLPASLRK